MTPAIAPQTLHRRAVVVDLHCDTVLEWFAGRRRLARRTRRGHIDLPRLQEGGVDVQVFAMYVAPAEARRGHARALELIDAFRREIAASSGHIAQATTVAEIASLVAAGRIAAVLAIESGDALQGRAARLEEFARLGVRVLSLTWNNATALGDGVLEEQYGGLTPLGRRVVRQMEEMGIVLDVSHLSRKAFWDAVKAGRGPFLATHSDAAALCGHARNLDDAQLRAIADRGGVVGVNFYPDFLGEGTLPRVLDHVDHMARVMGIDHVGLGSDFDGIRSVPRGLEDASKMPAVTRGLLRRGYSARQIRKILGENALRVFREVWGQ
ncbi:MAG: dipeptidase [Armatimonadetes bacterium]|nr:dipeptidase [Armatimonadota bacterium]